MTSRSDRIRKEIASYKLGLFEQSTLNLVDQYLLRDKSCIDVGANVGIWTAFLLSRVNPNVEVISVEPNPKCIKYLASFKSDNRLNNLRIEGIGLSSQAATRELFVNSNDEDSVFSSFSRLGFAGSHIVPVDTLDSLFFEEKTNFPGFLKIDVEGFELEVIAGGDKFLRAAMPDICLEVNMFSWAFREMSLTKLQDSLIDLGYEMYREVRNKLQKISQLSEIVDPISNIHCFSKTRVSQLDNLIRDISSN
jgi:FkbM family methyltransferase